MITVNHTLEIAPGGFTEGAEIYMNKHEQGNKKSACEMKQIGVIESAYTDKAVNRNFRIQQPDPGKNGKRQDNIHYCHIRHLLQRVEFGIAGYRERCYIL